jgi:hypothetical protein
MRFKFVLLIFLISFFCSCTSQVPLRVKKNFKFCYDQNVNYSHSFIKFNGYYIMKHDPFMIEYHDMQGNRKERHQDTTFNNIMFFEDGVFVLGDTKSNRTFYEIDYLKKVEQKKQPESEQFYNWRYWGIYKIDGDMIKLQYISHQPQFNPYWTLIEVWYKILDENTLKVVYAKDYIHENKSHDESIVTLEFIETNIQLPSDTWLKKEEWFWCDESEWYNYMESNGFKMKRKDRLKK